MAGVRVAWARGGRAMKGALLLVVAALALALALAGCTIQMALDTTVEADGSSTVGVRLAADKEIQDLMAQQAGQQGDLFGEFEKQVPKDWRVEKGTEANGTKWVKASKAFKDPAELDALLSGQAEGGLGGALAGDTFSVKQSRGLFRVTTTFDATWDAGKALANAQKGISDNVSVDMVASVFQVENRLTLPGTIKDNNATEAQGRTLVWRPSLKEATKLHAESVAIRWGVVGAFIAAGALVIAIVVVVAVLLIVRGRRRTPEQQSADPRGSASMSGSYGPDENINPWTSHRAAQCGRGGQGFVLKRALRAARVLGAVVAMVVIMVAAGLIVPAADRAAAASSISDTKAETTAARGQLSRLQAELDDLAGTYAKAEGRLYEIDNAVEKAEKDEARSRQDLEKMRSQLSDRIVQLYKGSHGSAPAFLELLFGEHDFSVLLERFSMLNKVAVQDGETFTQVQTYLAKVKTLQRDLAAKRATQATQLKDLQSTQTAMEARMQATAAEYKRLKKRVAVLEEAARRQREAEKANAQGRASRSSGSATAAKGFVFPVDGPHSYINDWDFARSGGRSHQGTDIMAARGTPVVAVVSGRIRRTAYGSGLGGTIVWLNGNNGVSYYYAHLDGIAGGISAGTSVVAGQTLGYVGNSGNARGGACHLHFEIHPGGGGATNPYYNLRASD